MCALSATFLSHSVRAPPVVLRDQPRNRARRRACARKPQRECCCRKKVWEPLRSCLERSSGERAEKAASVSEIDFAGGQRPNNRVFEAFRDHGIILSQGDSATHDFGVALRI